MFEIHWSAASYPAPGDLAHNPGMCPEQESNQQPFGLQAGTQSTEPHQPGLTVVLMYISQIANEAEHLFTRSFLICNMLFGEMSVHVFCPSNWTYFGFFFFFKISLLTVEFWGIFIYVLDTNPFLDMWFVNISSQFVACLFILLTRSLAEQKHLILVRD